MRWQEGRSTGPSGQSATGSPSLGNNRGLTPIQVAAGVCTIVKAADGPRPRQYFVAMPRHLGVAAIDLGIAESSLCNSEEFK